MRTIIHKTGYCFAFILPLLVLIGYFLGGYWNYLTVVFSFVIIPVIDHLLGVDTTNVEPSLEILRTEDRYYRFITFVWTFVQVAFVIWGSYAVTTSALHSAAEWIGFTLSFALVTGGIGITVAHELGHKKANIERLYAKALLLTVCYMHFYIEHNRGHHVHVATPEDPATARKGENFYSFWMRSVCKGYVHAWELETQSLNANHHPVWSVYNKMIQFALLPVLFVGILTTALTSIQGRFTWEVLLFFFSQSVVAFTLLELVNYIEHYGIRRKQLASGKYETVNPFHSWNASHLLSNFFLFQLQRHSDHHAAANKRYQVLKHHDVSPQLPFGYPTMIIIALLPPLWFKLMNERLETWRHVHGS